MRNQEFSTWCLLECDANALQDRTAFIIHSQAVKQEYLCEKIRVLWSTLSFIHMIHQHLPTTLPRLHEREDEGATIPSKRR